MTTRSAPGFSAAWAGKWTSLMPLWNGPPAPMPPAPDPSDARDAAATANTTPSSEPAPSVARGRGGLVRNTFYLTAAQAVTIPLSVLSNALVGRYLGAQEFGQWYLATTICTFAVLAFEWGQQGAVPSLVAREPSRAGTYLGTSLAFRSVAAVAVAGALGLVCLFLGYDDGVLWAVGLAFGLAVLNSFAAGFKDTIRGFERTDIPAIGHVAQQVMMVVMVVPVLLLGGRLRSLLLSHIAVAAVTVLYLRRSLGTVGVMRLTTERAALKQLLSLGTPFVIYGAAMVLQVNLNANFLAKLVPAEVIGWFGVSQRLIGLLIFPATALVGALYPTLCRLYGESRDEFIQVSRNALYGVSLIAIPAAVGCGFFAEVGVAIFGSREFSGAVDQLRVMSVFIFLVYFSMPLGISILASNRQKPWAVVQSVSVLVSLICNPLLIPYFQRRMGNGGIGTCVTLVLSETLVVAAAIGLSPRKLLDRGLAKSLLLAALAGAAMGLVAALTKPISLFLAMPLSVATYGALAWFSGAVQPSTANMIKGFVARRLGR